MPDALKKADEVLQQAVQGITDLINVPAVINLDFADVQTVMKDRGIAHIGIGTGKGDDKATDAVKMAVESPLLETKINGASNVIINISGDITLADASDASEYVRNLAGDDVNVIFGAMFDESKTDTCTITVIATGIEDKINTTVVKPAGTTAAPHPAVSPVQAQSQMQPTVVPLQAATVTPLQAVVPPTPVVVPETVSTVNIARPTQPLTLNKPSEIKSTVEPKSLKIPDFLQRK